MANNTKQNPPRPQGPQEVLVDKANVQEAEVISTLNKVTFTFKGFDFTSEKFRYKYLDNNTQSEVVEIMGLTLKEVTEPNPDYDKNKPAIGTNLPNITYQVGTYEFTQDWLNNFYGTSFNGNTATFQIEIFHLNAQFLQVVDNTIVVACKDSPIVTPIQGLLPLPFSNPFAEIGIRGAVPQETPGGSDELSWKSGYTEPYQRPTNRDGKWIKMGQYNQILHDITKSALILQDNLSILAGYINDGVDVKLDEVKDKIDNMLSKPPENAVLLTGNQNVAGFKNFTSVNINNFKNSPQAVANLEWCNGAAIQTANYWYSNNVRWAYGITYTITGKSGWLNVGSTQQSMSIFVNNGQVTAQWNAINSANTPSLNQAFPLRNKDIWKVTDYKQPTSAINFNTYMGA